MTASCLRLAVGTIQYRQPVSIRNTRAVKLAVLAALLPVAAVMVHARVNLGYVAGVVVDPSGPVNCSFAKLRVSAPT